MLTGDPDVRRWLDATAKLYKLPAWHYDELYWPGEWFEGLILQESSGDPKARRYEAELDKRTGDGEDGGKAEYNASWGPAQVMGFNVEATFGIGGSARHPITDFSSLQDWCVGVGFGLRVLLEDLRAAKVGVTRALARYNGGAWGERLRADGKFNDQEYVDAVARRAAAVQADRREKHWPNIWSV